MFRDHLLKPLEILYRGAVFSKNTLYRKQWVGTVKLPWPVLSVGNLTVGGSGKTAVVQCLLELAKKRGEKVAVISRNYKAECKGIHEIKPRAGGSLYFGDEPYLLSELHPEADVFVGPSKSETAQWLSSQPERRYDLVIIDDGFQHQKLHRDFNLVLIDTPASLHDYKLLPVGRARESVSTVFERADFVFLTKCNWAQESHLKHWKSLLEGRISYLELCFEFRRFKNLLTEEVRPFTELPPGPKLAFCGLGRPESFFANGRRLFGGELLTKEFPDHHSYTRQDLRALYEKVGGRGCLLTTEKDAVKLKNLEPLYDNIWVSALEISPLHSIELIYDKAQRAFSPRT